MNTVPHPDQVPAKAAKKTKDLAIRTLASVSRGYATDDQCAAAVNREKELICALEECFDALLTMRGMLSKFADISICGGSLDRTIKSTAALLSPPKK